MRQLSASADVISARHPVRQSSDQNANGNCANDNELYRLILSNTLIGKTFSAFRSERRKERFSFAPDRFCMALPESVAAAQKLVISISL